MKTTKPKSVEVTPVYKLRHEEFSILSDIRNAKGEGLRAFSSATLDRLRGLGLIVCRDAIIPASADDKRYVREKLAKARRLLQSVSQDDREGISELAQLLRDASYKCPRTEKRYFLTPKGSQIAKTDIKIIPPGEMRQ